MARRAVQVSLIVALGLGLGLLLLTRPWRDDESSVTVPTPQPSAPPPVAHTESPPPARSFKLPAMPPPSKASPSAAPEEPAEATPVLVPTDWLLRGSAPQNYDLRVNRAQVWSGSSSAQLRSHAKNISTQLSGSVMQTAIAEPYLGERVRFSLYLRAEEIRADSVYVWFRATDRDNLVLVSDNNLASKPKVTGDWARFSVVVDVPWGAAEIGYGATLQGTGTVWVDDARLETVDKMVVGATDTNPRRLEGVPVHVAKDQSVLASPRNLSFEEFAKAEAKVREVSRDAINSVRF